MVHDYNDTNNYMNDTWANLVISTLTSFTKYFTILLWRCHTAHCIGVLFSCMNINNTYERILAMHYIILILHNNNDDYYNNYNEKRDIIDGYTSFIKVTQISGYVGDGKMILCIWSMQKHFIFPIIIIRLYSIQHWRSDSNMCCSLWTILTY